jgi:cell division protein FtsW (lipid II flippase)
MSYGGSSMVAMCVTLGILLRIDWETQVADPRRQRKTAAEEAAE